MHDVQNLSNHSKLEGTISLKKSNAMSTQSEDSFETTAQIIGLYNRTIDPNRATRVHLNDDSLRRINRNRLTHRLRQAFLESHLPMRKDNEDDLQHEQKTDSRDHIHIVQHPALTANLSDT